jgi:hypothetical protein
MTHYRVTHAVRGSVVEAIVLDVPTPRAACERAAEWVLARFPGILAGQMTLQDVRQISDREAWSPLATNGRNDPTDGLMLRCN